MSTSIDNIFNNHYAALCNYANAIINDQHSSEDIVQTVFIQLWENKKLTQLENPELYLMKCVKFKSLDYLNKQKKTQKISLQDLPDISLPHKGELNEEDILPLIHFFTSQLPPKMQRVFLMSRQHQKSYQEIADELDISIKTVENQMGAALKKMRIQLKKHQYLSLLTIPLQ